MVANTPSRFFHIIGYFPTLTSAFTAACGRGGVRGCPNSKKRGHVRYRWRGEPNHWHTTTLTTTFDADSRGWGGVPPPCRHLPADGGEGVNREKLVSGSGIL